MAKINYQEISVGAVSRITLEIDTTRLERELLGVFRWRIVLARLLFKLGILVLRCNVEFKS